MTPNPSTPDHKQLARQRREARVLRTRKIRRGVAAGAVTLFVAFFSTIYAQMNAGHSTAATTSTSTAPSSQSASSSSSTPTVVTTQQS